MAGVTYVCSCIFHKHAPHLVLSSLAVGEASDVYVQNCAWPLCLLDSDATVSEHSLSLLPRLQPLVNENLASQKYGM